MPVHFGMESGPAFVQPHFAGTDRDHADPAMAALDQVAHRPGSAGEVVLADAGYAGQVGHVVDEDDRNLALLG